jgi:hypothetical protein
MMDADQNGIVDKQEFVVGLQNLKMLNIKAPDLGRLFDMLDVNND